MSSFSNCQTIFSEDFNGSLTYPLGWSLFNVDNNIPAAPVNYVTEAWVIRPNLETNSGNHAVSTSWYSPAGTANDWLIIPGIAVPTSGYFLEFDVMAKDAMYSDQFSVYINTTSTLVGDFTAPALILDSVASNHYERKSIDLSAYSGQTIYIAIVNSSYDKYLLFVDNIVVRIPKQNDAILLNTTLNRYSITDLDNSISMTVKNDGSNTITSLTVNWNDGATTHSSEIACSILGGETVAINHPIDVNYGTVVEKEITTTITLVNTLVDPTPSNNVLTNKINTVSELVQKNVLFEVGTSTECGTCIEGIVSLNEGYIHHPSGFIGINIHNNDVLTDSEYDSEVNVSNLITTNVDREELNIGNAFTAFENTFNNHSIMVVPASVEGEISVNNSDVQIIAKANFKTPMAVANYRLGVIISENNVEGIGTAYDQTNDYSGGSLGIMEGYEFLTNPIPASNMVYQYVGRTLLGGYDGQIGSIPTSITEGQQAQYTFNYTVPSTSVRTNMNATIVLIDQETGAIVNAKQLFLAAASIKEVANEDIFTVYPNPATDILTIAFKSTRGNYTISINDLSGRTIIEKNYSNLFGNQNITIPVNELAEGSYLVTVSDEVTSFSQQVIIK